MRRDKPMPNLHFRLMTFSLGFWARFSNPREILERSGIKKGQTILDYGCGTGIWTIPMAKIVGEEGKVYALDIHPLAIKSVEKKASKERLSNIKTILSGRDTGLEDESIDTVWLYDTFHIIKAKREVLQELNRILKHNGFLLMYDPHMKENKILEITAGLFSLRDRGKILNFRKESDAP